MADLIPLAMEPMLAKLEPELPTSGEWEYEPKWDGFRVVAHCSPIDVTLVSRGARTMTRYFPELVEPLRTVSSDSVVLDGEVILVSPGGLDFDALLQRVHPAESRVRLLSEKTPVSYVAFDILAKASEDLRSRTLAERRQILESTLDHPIPRVHLTPYTREPEIAARWFEQFEGAGLDGVIAKGWESRYLPGKRGWVKVKHERTADCLVIGFRWDVQRQTLGSLLLGLYDADAELQYVGHTSSFTAQKKREVLELIEPYRVEKSPIPMGRMPGGPSRWSRGRETDWEPLRPELVCEVAYDKLQSGHRFRHATTFKRWRPDKPPEQCTFDQIVEVARYDVSSIFG